MLVVSSQKSEMDTSAVVVVVYRTYWSSGLDKKYYSATGDCATTSLLPIRRPSTKKIADAQS